MFQCHGEVLYNAIGGRHRKHLFCIKTGQVLDEDRATHAVGLVKIHTPPIAGDLGALSKGELLVQAVHINFLAPLFCAYIHVHRSLFVKIPRTQKAEKLCRLVWWRIL